MSTIDVVATERGADPAARLRAARRPVLLAGIGAVRARATEGLVALAEGAGIPVVVAPMAMGVFPEDHPYFAGGLDMACNTLLWRFLGASDLIVAAGFDAVELIKPWSVATPVLHVDSTPNTDQIYPADVEVVGDIGGALRWLAGDWAGQPRWTESAVADHRAVLREAYYHGRQHGVLNPTDVVDEVADAAPEGAIAVSDVGSHKLLVGQGWCTREPRECLMTNGLSAMGLGLPRTIAAKLAGPDRAVIGMVGDGGFAMMATELRLASALGLGIRRHRLCGRQPQPYRAQAAGPAVCQYRHPNRVHQLGDPRRVDGLRWGASELAGGPGQGPGRPGHVKSAAGHRGAHRPGAVRVPVLSAAGGGRHAARIALHRTAVGRR